MTAHLFLLCHAPTAATRAGAFAGDEALDEAGTRQLASLEPGLRRFERCLVSPAKAARQTAAGLGLSATVHPALADCDFGRWRGREIADVHASDPDAIAAWMRDPQSASHGGESLQALMDRVGSWLAEQQAERGLTLAITHAAVVRAATVRALAAGAPSFWRIDIAPLSVVRLSGHGGRWNLVSLGPMGPAT